MFQRLKGAIDSRIAEEQARQRSALTSPPPPNTARKSSSRAESPAKRALRPGASSKQNGETAGKGPDPAEFEPEFVLDHSDVPSRSVTPRPAPTRSESPTKDTAGEVAEEVRNGEETSEKVVQDGSAATSLELPTDVRVKLRRMEKLESRYHELLRSYRVAHARVQTIDTFEASLRESTPLTSISDPRALVEYLNQLNLKSDMVVDELKRVSHDRDMYKQQLGDAEKQARDAWDEVANLREANGTAGKADHKPHLETETSSTQVSLTEQSKTDYSPSSVTKSPPTSAKSPTGSLTSLSIFSPKSKPVESPIVKNTPEDLFSYDDEVPRLQAEVKDRDERIGKLQGEVINLKGDLAVTRESTQSMVQTLEEATRELNNLRDHKDRSSAEIAEERETSKKLSDKLQADVKATEAKLRDVEVRHRSDNIERLDELKQQLNQANDELQILREKARTSDEKTSEVQSLQRRVIFLENEISETRAAKELSEKKADTASSLLKTVRDELAENERKYTDIVSSKETLKETLQERIRYLENPEKQQGSHNAGTGLKDKIEPSTNVSQALNQTPENVSRKKNKKKKKGGKPVGEQTTEPQLTASEPVPTQTLEAGQDFAGKDENLRKLRDEIDQCRQQLEEKDTALEKMRSKLKDQDDLKEEIEGLRDNLIDVGQEHVQAKEKVKELQAEKRALQDTVASLERELVRLQGLQASNTASADQRQQDLSIQFEELKTKATALQTNLSAAEQLASSRFKELSELKAVIQEAQPELTSLRSEVKDLKSIKESHDKKEAELKRIEARQQDMYTEIAMQKRIVAERDAEVRGVNQKLAQENSSRSQAEDARSKANEEIQRLETEKRQAAESLDKLSKDLSGARDEITNLRGRTKELEQQIIELKRSNEGLKDEIELKTAQHASAQSLMSSMRDQTTEMAVQVKEARERCESLDEEVADAHRLLSERSREGETMRRLLSDIEGKTEARTREMKERMENAIEERDRAEDEASTAARRRARELDDLRNKVREAERSLKRAEDDKEELETAQRDWKRRREELEHRSEQSVREAEEVRRAMGELRDALDGSEQQAREAEKQKAELRRGLENTQHRLERLQKSNKSMADEIRTIQATKSQGIDSEAHSSRSSFDSSAPSRARLASPAPTSGQSSTSGLTTPNGQTVGSMDFVYLKNVLLQFLEQKDKNHQKQLIPVLGMLLHFDRKDEQRWMSAITSK